MPSVSPRRTVSADVLHGMHRSLAAGEDALLDREVLRQVLDLDERSSSRAAHDASTEPSRGALAADRELPVERQVARVGVRALGRDERRHFLVARREAVWAARVERAAGRRREQGRR